MTDLHYLSVAEAAALIRDRKLSPVEYTEALLARIDRIGPQLDAFLEVTREHALGAARTAEAAVAAGERRGPLHGVPYGLKDIVDFAGLRTTAHSKVLTDNVASAHATVAAKLEAAGGILLGKLATHEFAIGGPAFDLPWPPARNPWNRERHPGGSSSGSGSAVAAGLLPMAIGTDTGGSVRNPASMCGIVGMKATYGRVSRAGVAPLSFSLDHVGPMTRTVEDNALMLNVIAGHDPRDPGSAAAPERDFTAGLRDGVKGLRIGFVRHFHTRDLEADPEMTAGIEAAAGRLEALGARIQEISLAPLDDYAACNRVILLSEAYAIHEKWLQERPADYARVTRNRLLPGAFLRAADYVQATRLRTKLLASFEATMRDFDLLICASSMEPACKIDDAETVERTYPRQARTPFNVLGVPALAMPCGFSSDGMPLAFQIVGKAFDEATIYRAAWAYEQDAGWHARRPPLD